MKGIRRSWAGVGVLCPLAMGILSLVIANDGDISWEGKGPGGGGSNLGVAVDPNNPENVLMGSDTGGIYRSTNGGSTWENTNVGAITNPHGHRGHYFAETFAYDPVDTQRVYAGTRSGVLKSTDAGASWTESLYVYGGAAVVAVNPHHPEHVYAASGSIFGPGNAWGGSEVIEGCLFVSHDYGGTFGSPIDFAGTDCSIAGTNKPNIRSILIDPTGNPAWDATKVLISTSWGLYRSMDGGQSWSALSGTGLPHQNCGQLVFDGQTGTIYLAMLTEIDAPSGTEGYRSPESWKGGVFKSTDWGSSWANASGVEGSTILLNGGFDDSEASPPPHWSYLSGSADFVSLVEGPGPVDRYRLAIVTPDQSHEMVGVRSDVFPVTEGARYRISALASVAQDVSSALYATAFLGRIRFFSDQAATGEIAENRCSNAPFTNLWAVGEEDFNWRSYETEVLVPDGAHYAKIDLFTHLTQGVTFINSVTVKPYYGLPRVNSFISYTFNVYRALAADPTASNTVYVGTDGANNSFNPDGIWKTVDGGDHWTHETRFIYHDNVTDKRANTDPASLQEFQDDCGHGYGYGRVYGIGIGKLLEGYDTLYMTTGFWSYKKPHGSSQWEEITHDADPPNQRTFWKARGVTNDVVTHDVKATSSRVFYGDQDNLLLISDNEDGETYRQEGRDRGSLEWGSMGLYGGTVSSIVVQDQDHAYVSVENGGQGSGVVSVSFNSGTGAWDPERVGGTPPAAGALPEGGRLRLGRMNNTLYAALEGPSPGRGVYRKDSGWTNIGAPEQSGFPSTFIPMQVTEDEAKGRLYVGLGNILYGESPCDCESCLFMSPNPGSAAPTWCPLTNPPECPIPPQVPPPCPLNEPCRGPIASLRVGPANELYVGTIRTSSTLGGLYKAIPSSGCNSGVCGNCTWTWSRILDEPSVTGIAVSPLNPSILYAASAQENGVVNYQEAGIWKSIDGGTYWNRLDHNGLGSLKTPVLDYSAEGGTLTIWAATEGSGVFKGTIMVPATPTGLTAAAVSGRKINLQWQDTSKAETGWIVERRKGLGGAWTEVFHQNGPDKTSYTSTNLIGGITYYFRVRAYDEAGNSLYSNEASDTAF